MNNKSDTWIVGLINNNPKQNENTWSAVGVYDEEQKAIEVCDSPDHFVGLVVMNETNNDVSEANGDISPWPGAWFPYSGENPWTDELILQENHSFGPKL